MKPSADRQDQSRRLNELDSVSGWRFVVASRPGAWEETYRGATGLRIVELLDLAYPEDVHGFVESWFAGDPNQGQELVKQIDERPELRRAVVVPLLLTFFCILSDVPEMGKRLPTQRRELYSGLVRRLLIGRWTSSASGPDSRPSVEACEALLRRWAWGAVKDRSTPSGLGNWGDTFIAATQPRHEAARVIDHIAPKVGVTEEGVVTRRFVHRTLMEHFVAEHIATLKADEAAEILLPHLWFDPDWAVAAPAAIAAHHRRQPGVLLGKLLDRADHPAMDPDRQAARTQLDRILTAVVVESDAGAWSADQQDLRHLHSRLLSALLGALADAGPSDVARLVGGLLSLVPTADERAELRRWLLAALHPFSGPWVGVWVTADLMVGLAALAPTAEERRESRDALMAYVHSKADCVVGGLVALAPTVEERRETRSCSFRWFASGLLVLVRTIDKPSII